LSIGDEAKSDMEDIRDAYERFYRLRERYEHESNARTLGQTEEEALRKVFREDKFIESVGRVRGISAHVETGDVELLGLDKVAFRLTAESSAAAVYAARCVHLTDTQGRIQRINHLNWLTEAENRIARAIAKAKEA